jgi:hypothetical protein
VEDLSRAAEFYESIGFRRGKEESDRIPFYVNWFFVTLVAQDGTEVGAKEPGRRIRQRCPSAMWSGPGTHLL